MILFHPVQLSLYKLMVNTYVDYLFTNWQGCGGNSRFRLKLVRKSVPRKRLNCKEISITYIFIQEVIYLNFTTGYTNPG